MKPSGVLIALFGAWLGWQVLAGDALSRLGVSGQAPQRTVNVDPKTGIPNQNPNLPYLTGPNGYVL